MRKAAPVAEAERDANRNEGPRSEHTPPSSGELYPFLLELGRALLASGDAVSDIEQRLVAVAKAYGQPDTRVMVLPGAVAVSGGPREPATFATAESSGQVASVQLRLDQITEVLGVARSAATGKLSPAHGIEVLRGVRAMPSRHRSATRVLGYELVTVGIGLLIRPSAELLPSYLALGLYVALLREAATRVAGLASILPLLAALTVSAIAFGILGPRGPEPLETLIPPLVLFLPGGLLTMATVDLASDEVVTGASRFLAGMLQLTLLALGIVAGATLVGVTSTTASHGPAQLLGSWAPWLGVLVFGLGTALEHSAPRQSLPWLMLVLYVAWGGQVLGDALFGPHLSGFVGGLVVAPLATTLERFPSAPPALVSFLPAFWLLVPGALGLIGFTQLVGNDPVAGATTFLDALISVIAIALGIMVGLRTVHIAQQAYSSARRQVIG